MAKTLYMETTKIPVSKTIGEIEWYLAQAGATGIAKEYGPDKEPNAVMFKLPVEGGVELPFMLPANAEPVFEHLQAKRSVQYRRKGAERDREQAPRVAWRQILKWVQAQLALMETGMVKAEEIFLPYMQVGLKETLYQRFAKEGFQGKLLTAGQGDEP